MLDGKYEITSERELGERVTRFGATAPDGTALTISWYELETPADEHAFEQYRTLLRQLRRRGHAAIFDLVSRPGAHYVAWRLPRDVGALPVTTGAELGAIEEILSAYERSLGEASVCAPPDAPAQVYALEFAALPTAASPPGQATPVSSQERSQEGSRETRKPHWATLAAAVWTTVRPWSLAGVSGLLGIFLLSLSLGRLVQSELVSVPEVQGQDVNTALTKLYGAGFQSVAVPLTSPRPAGMVLEVRPEAGTPLRPGRTLSVRYALPAGSAPEASPNVVGQPLAQAEAELQRAGFLVSELARSYSPLPRGTVIAQSPDAATPAAREGHFALLVSDGPLGELTFVPDLTGLSQEDALGLAEAAGFDRSEVELERTPGNGTPAGTVLAQNIAPYVSVSLGAARLRLVLAAPGGEGVSDEGGTPDLTGLDLGTAQRQARALGLSVVAEAQVSAPELPTGVVLQRPEPGAPLSGSVRVTLNRAPLVVPIPEVSVNVVPTASAGSVRRARYVWQLGGDAGGRRATVTVTLADGTQETVARGQLVTANERLGGTYLTTATGPLVFTLTLDAQPYGAPVTVP